MVFRCGSDDYTTGIHDKRTRTTGPHVDSQKVHSHRFACSLPLGQEIPSLTVYVSDKVCYHALTGSQAQLLAEIIRF